ncbi:beta-carotene 15,15'-dioxygenase, Brp/Blh family, partial [Bradyrhizobium sp. NBAIM08]|uniref:beta-carotene 15,15'-dioxygenase, Brp/Blh family n=1 Tax=Bradyrhizobium sp. NBAIM08 TaxID=2793815 RepID=UPI001CD4D771
IILLGVPHGALDGEVARPLLRPRWGRWWFGVFAVPYLLLAAAVLLAWRLAPEATLAGFLTLSAWHFGSEEAPGRPWEAFVRGGLPIAAPTLLQPHATAEVLGVVAGLPLDGPPAWLLTASWVWAGAALAWLALGRPSRGALLEGAALVLA